MMARQTEEGPDADAFIHTCLAGARRLGVVDRLARAARFAALRERCAARVVERTLRRCGACTCAAKVIQQRWAKALRERRRGNARLRNHPWAEALGVAAEKDAAEVVTTWGDRASDALELMLTRRYRHLPVQDENGKCIAMVSIRDLYEAVKESLEENIRETEAFVFGDRYSA